MRGGPAKPDSANIHASCVAIGPSGVLLLGESGSGKSDLALRLIDEGARLVADDRTELFARGRLLCARAPRTIAGRMEVRGLGIIVAPTRASAVVRLAVALQARPERVPPSRFYVPPGAVKGAGAVPLIFLEALLASAPARIRLALDAFAKGLIHNELRPSSGNRK